MNLKKNSAAYITYIIKHAFVQTSTNWLNGPKNIGQSLKIKEKYILGILT